MAREIKRLAWGAASGVLATGFMTAVMIAGQKLGLLAVPPPKTITRRAAQQIGLQPAEAPHVFQVAWIASHIGYGAIFGVVYSLVRGFLPGRLSGGVLYGLGLWASSYLAFMPDLGLYPPPEHDNLGRAGTMIAAHLVYGASLSELDRR